MKNKVFNLPIEDRNLMILGNDCFHSFRSKYPVIKVEACDDDEMAQILIPSPPFAIIAINDISGKFIGITDTFLKMFDYEEQTTLISYHEILHFMEVITPGSFVKDLATLKIADNVLRKDGKIKPLISAIRKTGMATREWAIKLTGSAEKFPFEKIDQEFNERFGNDLQ